MELFLDSLMDTVKMIPFLALTFIAIEYFEHKFGKKFADKIKSSGKFGPILGAILGIIPQCGFSIMGVAFYSEGLITLGTLISIFIATSDEALPVLVSNPSTAGKVLPLVMTKLLLAILWGYIIDTALRRKNLKSDVLLSTDNSIEPCEDECINAHFVFADIFKHSLKRTAKIALYIFVINFAIGAAVDYSGFTRFASLTYGNQPLQIGISSIIGLIPNCAISIGLVEVYLNHAIGFPSLVAGLSSNAGLALLVLFKESKRKKDALYLTLLLVACSFLSGIILYYIGM